MKIEWCVCDLDGTLLNSQGRISDKNIKAVHTLQRRVRCSLCDTQIYFE
jgi:hydroxymethylpyrimidine pyrophosphatase-like HAD family hydrolase